MDTLIVAADWREKAEEAADADDYRAAYEYKENENACLRELLFDRYDEDGVAIVEETFNSEEGE